MDIVPKLEWESPGRFTYHFAIAPIIVRWNSRSLTESSTMLLEEHHRWKDMTCLVGSSPCFPSNIGMSKGSLLGMVVHVGSWYMGSLVIFARSGKFKLAMNVRFVFVVFILLYIVSSKRRTGGMRWWSLSSMWRRGCCVDSTKRGRIRWGISSTRWK